jgi:regulator of replication initiation timing
MGHKKKSPLPSPTHLTASNTDMEAQLAAINANILQISSKMDSMQQALHDLRVENCAMREELAAARVELGKKDEVISALKDQVNRIDQASRARSLRIHGLPVTKDTSASLVPKIVWKEIIAPILHKAIEAADLPASFPITHYQTIIDDAYTIPAKKGGSCPVILKLVSSNIRHLIFQHKKTTLPTVCDLPSNKVRAKYSIFEDLSPTNHAHFREISADPRVRSAWTFNGQIRFKIQDCETIFRVKALSDSVDSLTKGSSQGQPQSSSTAMSP